MLRFFSFEFIYFVLLNRKNRILKMVDFNFAYKYLKYKLTAGHQNGHGIHSPFLFDLIANVISDEKKYYAFFDIDDLRNDLLESKQKLKINDFGAGSKKSKKKERTVGDITKNSSVQPRYGEMLFRIVNHFQPKTILELGTGLGLSTIYLAKPNSKTKVYTVDADSERLKVAKQNFEQLKCSNIQIINDSFNYALPELLRRLTNVDFVYFDGNHRKEPILDYFSLCLPHKHDKTVFIFDDIHWSTEMEDAWRAIKEHPKVVATLDLFYVGIVFFKSELQHEHFVINY